MIYLDNAATSFPKAPGVAETVAEFIKGSCGNVNRTTGIFGTEEIVRETRALLAELFGCGNPDRVIFTSGATASLNMLVGGLLSKSDHVIVSTMEHHALMRPLTLCGADISAVAATPNAVAAAICPNTRLIAIAHASNVTGQIADIQRIGELARKHGIFFAVDAAQTAGAVDIRTEEYNIDFLAFPGHKGLMGPQGIGGFVISDALAAAMKPYIAGGTGNYSHMYGMPPILPDRFEPGTLNLPGIAGLNCALKFIFHEGIKTIRVHESDLTRYFINRLQELPVRIYSSPDPQKNVGVISITSKYCDDRILSERIAERGVVFRYGLHCSPMAHETLGTLDRGTMRFSIGYFNSVSDIDKLCDILTDLL